MYSRAQSQAKTFAITNKLSNPVVIRNQSNLVGMIKLLLLVFMFTTAIAPVCGGTPIALPFEVSNPTNAKWSPEEAGRIYDAACALVARSIRPEKPPHLHPRFLLVLGSTADEIVRTDNRAEIHLKTWNPDKFAEAAAIMVAREVIQGEELRNIAHLSVLSAQATTSITELRRHQ